MNTENEEPGHSPEETPEETRDAAPGMVSTIGKNSVLLALLAAFCTALVVGIQLNTRERILEQKRLLRNAALLAIIPREQHDNDMLDEAFTPPGDAGVLGYAEPRTAFIARRDERIAAVILPLRAPDGYTGAIDMLIGVARDGRISGVRVIAHRETPGLGDQLELQKSPWVLDFNGKSLRDPAPEQWRVRRDGGVFDQFTGATITPRAVVAAVRRALEYTRQNHRSLFSEEAAEHRQAQP